MKFTAMMLLIAGILCSSMLASAEGPVPFKALMQSAATQPAMPSTQDSGVPVQRSRTHMTRGGKIETGIGIGLVGLGVVFIAGGASVKNDEWFAGETRAIGFGGGAVFAGVGTTLIILGTHRRSK